MLIAVDLTSTQKRFWIGAIVLFGIVSGIGFLFGGQMAHRIAVQFHEHAAEQHLVEGDLRGAVKEFTALHWLEPENEEAVLRLADTHLMLGQWLDARDWLEMLEDPSEGVSEYNFLMTQVALESESDDAEEWLARVRDTASSESGPRVDLLAAHVAGKTGDNQTAIEGYRAILDAYPDHGEAAYRLSRGALFQLRNGDVVEHLHVMKNASDDYAYTAEFREMQRGARFALRHGQADLNAGEVLPGKRLEMLGLAALNLGQWERAADFFAQADAAGDAGWSSDFWLGVRAQVQGDRDGAIARFRAAASKQKGANLLPQRNVDNLAGS